MAKYVHCCGNCEHTELGLVYTSPPKVLCELTGEFHYLGDLCDANYDISAADVKPVVRGEWIQVVRKNIYDEEYRLTRCTACGYEMNNEVFFEPWRFRYCPNCGAKMEVDDG